MMMHLDSAAQLWWTWMWPMFWQAGLFILIVWGIDRLIRRWAWPQVCYALWLLVLLKLVCPPWLASPTSLTAGLFSHKIPQLQAAYEPQPAPMIIADSAPSLTDDLISPQPAPKRLLPAASSAPAITAPWWQIAGLLIWLSGFAVLSVVLVFRWRALRRAILADSEVSHTRALADLLDEIAGRLRLRRRPTLVFSARVASPAVLGPLRPILILPEEYQNRQDDPALRYILLHELAHIKRGDLLLHSAFIILQAFYWFNPLLWLARRRLQALRELCCDATVAGILREETPAYRETLLHTAERLLGKRDEFSLGLLGLIEQSGSIIARLRWLEKKVWRHGRLRQASVCGSVTLILILILPMARPTSLAEAQTNAPVSNTVHGRAGDRTVRFPGKLSIGKFKRLDNAMIDRWRDYWVEYSSYRDTGELDEALDEVTVPPGKGLVLYVDKKQAGGLSFMEAFQPDDIQVLDLSNLDALKDEDLAHLGKLTGLKVLSLHASNVSDAGIKYLKPLTSLHFLMLNHDRVTDKGLTELQELKSLDSLQIHNTLVTNEGLAALAGMPRLKHLRIGGKNISDAGLAQLKGLVELESLWIQASPVTDAGLASVASLSSLRELELAGTKITDRGFEWLSKLPVLTTLQIYGTSFTMAAIPALKRMQSLRSLTIGSEALDEKWFGAVQAALPKCQIKDYNHGGQYPRPAWRERFDAVYSLRSGEVLRRVAPPFIPERKQYYLSLPGRSDPNNLPVSMVLHWNKNLRNGSTTFGHNTFPLSYYISDAGGISRDLYTGPKELLARRVPACDWIVATSSSVAQRFEALEKILSTEMNLKIRIARKELGGDVIVVSGRYKPAPRTDARNEEIIRLSMDEAKEKDSRGIHVHATVADLLQQLAASTRHQIVNRAEFSDDDKFTIQDYVDSDLFDESVPLEKKNTALQKIFDGLTKQTSLQFKVEHRPVSFWVVSKR